MKTSQKEIAIIYDNSLRRENEIILTNINKSLENAFEFDTKKILT